MDAEIVAPSVSETARLAREALSGVSPEPGARKPDPIMTAVEVRRSFGGITAVDVDRVEVQRGSITALIGPNGAGKTTFFNLLTGFDTPDQGNWTFNGVSLEKVAAHKTAGMGMVRTFQLTKSLTKMSVIENMKLGATGQSGEKWWNGMFPFLWRAEERAIEARADELLQRFKLDHMRDEVAETAKLQLERQAQEQHERDDLRAQQDIGAAQRGIGRRRIDDHAGEPGAGK